MDGGGVAAAASVSKKKKQWLNNQDLISGLPDEILDIFISRLPIKAAARTAVLSSRWRHLWRSAPLNLAVDRRLSGWERDRIAIVCKILAAHPGPVRRLSLHDIICLRRGIYGKIDRLFRSPTLDGLEELDFTSNGSYYGDGYGGDRPPRPLPPSALRFAPTLRAVSIDCCDFPEMNAGPVLRFPRLKQLKLYDIAISQAAIHRLLAGCIVLESLELGSIHGLNTVQIVSPTLRSIVVSVSYYNRANVMLQELVIEDAPCLERLIPHGNGPKIIRVISAPKLTVLGYLSSKITKLVIGTIIVKEMIPTSLTGLVRTVKILVLESIGPNLDAIVGFLRCFPCMEKLYIQSRLREDMENVQQYDTVLDPIECLDHHLRTIVLKSYEGKIPDVNFAKFFVLNAKVLKVMKFVVYGASWDEKWMASQHMQLQLDNKASRDAQFYFERTGGYSFTYNKHVHDMWIPDPFDSSVCK